MPKLLFFSAALLISLFWGQFAAAQFSFPPAKSLDDTFSPFNEASELANFRLLLDYESKNTESIELPRVGKISLPSGSHQFELVYEHTEGNSPLCSTFLDGKPLDQKSASPAVKPAPNFSEKDIDTSGDFTVSVQFQTKGTGTLFAKCSPRGKWSPNAKALFIRGGRLVYDIGWVGALSTKPKVNNGKSQHAVLIVSDGKATLYLNKKEIGKKSNFSAKDDPDHVFKIGEGAADFTGKLTKGAVTNLRFWKRAIDGTEKKQLIAGELDQVNTPDLNFSPAPTRATFPEGYPGVPVKISLPGSESFTIKSATVQPLEPADHRKLFGGWNQETLARGKQIYHTLCVTCHGTPEKEGTLPTALRFHLGEFKNGSDPYRMYQTLKNGFGMMVPQPQYLSSDKYAVIQYIRETFLRDKNPGQHFAVTDQYLAKLPRPLTTVKESRQTVPDGDDAKPYQKMDFGPAMFWTYQVDKERDILKANIAQKGIAIRLDKGPGGVSKGNAWMIYDEDTMRVATGYTGSFVDWKGIAFDGSHGTHTSIAGQPLFINPNQPAWQNPWTKKWDDSRIVGRDGRKFGPLPKDWVHYKGTYLSGDDVIIKYTVGEAEILEKPGFINYGSTPVFTRTLNVSKSPHELVTRVAPSTGNLHVLVKGSAEITAVKNEEGWLLTIPASATPVNFAVGISQTDPASLAGITPAPTEDLSSFTKGKTNKPSEIITEGIIGKEANGFASDTLTMPQGEKNPSRSWMRLGGFDFFPDNPDRAVVCTWMGDVWLVDGVAGDLKKLKWRRICSGLFQPLGLKIVGGKIYVTCRDQIARLHDFNGDEQIDFIENFNNDHQVTEHFHEFAMGLQVDGEGNFYYAKSARHAKTALVPHHGTLLKVSPDGKETTILATGFRAANGVCLNPDGTWIVTDQEGHWNPKNRINYVRKGGFYGNIYGYTDVTDESDEAMEQPLCWITNGFDRSPAELIWVPKNAGWGALNGTLLNLSYGYGNIYTVPHEVISGQAQGGMCRLPLASFPTGIHRGRFHPENGQLYVAGMFAWAGNQKGDGGFFRVRSTGNPSHLPIGLRVRESRVEIDFTDEISADSKFSVKTWDLKRTKNYGSKHYNEKELEIDKIAVEGKTATLTIPDLAPTRGMEIKCDLGGGIERVIHNSIHRVK